MHPGQLKLALVHRGIILDPALRARGDLPDIAGPVAATDPTVELALPGELLARVRIRDHDPSCPFVLTAVNGNLVVRIVDAGEPESYDVRLSPLPRFYGRSTARGTAMRAVAAVHGSYIAIRPDMACGLSAGESLCGVCTGGSRLVPDWNPAVEDVVDVVRAAFEEGVAEFVYFTAPCTDTADRGIASLEPHVKAIKRHFNTLVAAHLHPPAVDEWIDRAYAVGIDALSFGVEIFDSDTLRRHCPGRIEQIGRERYYAALAHAASIFPSGAVWSDLILGLEPESSTMHGIEALAAIGVVPVLRVPSLDAPLEGGPSSATDMATSVGSHLYTVVKEHRINMGWVRDLSTSVPPLEARFFAGDEAWLAVAMQNFYRSRVGGLTARNLARFRRRLRVRAVSDSFHSSGL